MPMLRISLLSLALLAVASPALAQDAAGAEALFLRGKAEMEAGQYEPACKLIAESYRLDPRAGTLFSLAKCERLRGHIASAVTHYGDYLSLFDRMTPKEQQYQTEQARPEEAKAQRDLLRPDVPELTLSLPKGAPEGTVVKRNDVAISTTMLGMALPVDPGEHVLSTQAPGGPVWEQRITIAPKEKRQVVLEVKAPAAAEPTAPPPTATPSVRPSSAPSQPPGAEARTSSRRVAAYVLGGAGLSGLVIGAVTGGLALGKKGTLAEHCGAGIGSSDRTACDPTGLAALQEGRALALASTIGFVAGLAGVGAGVVLRLSEPRQGQAAAGARGTWLSATVLSASPEGAMVGVRGAW